MSSGFAWACPAMCGYVIQIGWSTKYPPQQRYIAQEIRDHCDSCRPDAEKAIQSIVRRMTYPPPERTPEEKAYDEQAGELVSLMRARPATVTDQILDALSEDRRDPRFEDNPE